MKKDELAEQNGNGIRLSRRDALCGLGGAGLGLLSVSAANPLSVAAQGTSKGPKTTSPDSPSKENLQGAGFYRFKVGEFECAVISDGIINLPPQLLFIAPKSEIEQVLRDNFLPIDKLTLHINALVVKTDRSVVLMDTGVGNTFGPTVGFLKTNLQRAGIAPEAITDIVFTHAHFDHIGGTIDAADQFNYPRARYHLSQPEWEMSKKPKAFLGQAKVDEATLQVIEEGIRHNLDPLKDRVSLFKSDSEIIPGITATTAYGHTPGHSAYLVTSGNERLLFVGDLIHHAAVQFARPGWYVSGDSSPEQAIAARKRIIDRVVDDRILLMGSHLPFPGVGHVRARDAQRTAYEWIPIEWQWT